MPAPTVSTCHDFMKALFYHGPSATVRLVIAIPLAVALLAVDTQSSYLDPLRAVLSVVIYPLQVSAALPTRLRHQFDHWLASEDHLGEELAQLRAENLMLRGRLQKYVALEAENRRLRGLLGSTFKIGERVLIAELLAIDIDPYRHQVLIDKGTTSGVFVGQPVLDANAVMGQVVRATPLTATVLLITDAAHSLPVQVNRNGLRAIATGSGMINQLDLLHVPKEADIRPGDLLVTSGLGGAFPAGYPVAKVTEVRSEAGQRFATVRAQPTARLDRSHEVLLVWTLANAREEAEAETEDEATAADEQL